MRGGEFSINNLSEKEQGYLFGLFEGDGYKIDYRKSRHYQVEFYLNSERDKKIIDFLISLLNKLNLRVNVYQDKRFNCKRIRTYSESLFNVIQKNILLEDKSDEFKLGFISGFLDSEGHVDNKKYCISIMNTNLSILQQCKKHLESIGINSSLNKRKPSIRDKLPSYRMYISVNFKSLPHLSLKAGYNPKNA